MSVAVGVGVVVRDEDGRVLLGRREKTGEPVTWSLPGGTLEPGETFEQAAVRELAEETGLAAEAVTVVGLGLTHREGYGPGWTAAVVADSTRGEAHVAAPHEFSVLSWFAHDDLPAPLFGPTRYVLDAVAGRPSEGATYAVVAR